MILTCHGCKNPLPDRTVVFCRTCWFKIPANERIKFHGYYTRNARNRESWVGMADRLAKLTLP